jgi:hypothetical protein
MGTDTTDITYDWADRWGIPWDALEDLRKCLTAACSLASVAGDTGRSEAAVSSRIRLEAPKLGYWLGRNNRGAGYMQDGSFIRWGLANDSIKMDKVVKSGDFIGFKRTVVAPSMVGSTVAIFTTVEAKNVDWKYSNSAEEQAQMRWNDFIILNGGIAKFVNDASQL